MLLLMAPRTLAAPNPTNVITGGHLRRTGSWFQFQVLAYVELPMFAWKMDRKQWFWATILVIGSFFYLLAHWSLTYSGWATFCVFGLPWCLDHADDEMRNWCQHLFVVQYDSPAPCNSVWDVNCGHAYVLIDSVENRKQFNEGYHVVHHANGGKHWSEMPNVFYKHVNEYMADYEEDLMCVVFADSSIWEVWSHVASGKLAQLIKNKYVHIPTKARPTAPTVGEVVEELTSRFQKLDISKRISSNPQAQKRRRFDRHDSHADLSSDIVEFNDSISADISTASSDDVDGQGEHETEGLKDEEPEKENLDVPKLVPISMARPSTPCTTLHKAIIEDKKVQ
mmetsp:Transcript_7400/g.18192  ORF Transcript_7400/g.18192 Transcript_7400/m.18192 type:complete len:338 (+) Transcript_7400:927-1940(+)